MSQAGRWTDALLDSLRSIGDPDADAVVAAYFEGKSDRPDAGGAAFFQALAYQERPEQFDPVVAAYLSDNPAPPAWLDPASVGRAQEWFGRVGTHVFAAMYGASLPTAYACWRGAQVLGLTARLETDAHRRLNETAQFVLDLMRRGGLEPDGAGYRAARRVRLMHAGVRWLILRDPRAKWDHSWGRPINQEDLLETVLTFTEVVFEVFDRTGVVYTASEAEDFLHLWSRVAVLLGVRADLLPLRRADATDLMGSVRRRQYGASDAGRLLAAALVDQSRQASPRGLRGLGATTIRWYVGPDTADLLGVPAADWTRLLFGPLAALSRVTSAEALHHRFLQRLSSRFGRAMLSFAVSAERGGDRASFEIPTELQEPLGVKARRGTT